jgi:uncharacterized coiled-coil DUF342 family protein
VARERGKRLTEQKTTESAAVNQQIEAVSKKLTTLKDDLNKTHQEIVRCKENRDQLNEKVKTLRQEIGAIKKERDRLNESVKTLKQQRDEVRAQMAPFIEVIKEHSQKVRDLKAKRSGERRQDLQKAFDALEFQIATTSLDLKEEKRLIDQVKEIEVQLSVYKKIDQHLKKINEVKTELKVLEDKADLYHRELTENAKKSQELHAGMLGKFEEMKKLRDEATNLHLQFLLNREKIKPLHEEIGRSLDQRQKLFGLRQEQFTERQKQFEANKMEIEKQKRAKEQEIKEKMGSAVREKLQRGEKLDWREFQLLASDEAETED